MLIRLTFASDQKLSKKYIDELSKDLGDIVECTQLCKNQKGEITKFWEYSYTADPNDNEIKEGKKSLVELIDLYSLDTVKEYIADSDVVFVKHPELKFIVRGAPPVAVQDYSSVIKEIVAIQEKFQKALESFDSQVEFNQKCDVHISNLGLLHINQLGYAVDYCTVSLQTALNQGWRIIACCVQPDGRRPDYVLGRYNPDETDFQCVKF
jgi:hypothetical protein